MLEIAEADVEEALTHNHHINWTKKSVKKFNDHGWLTFMFIRNPKDIKRKASGIDGKKKTKCFRFN